MNILASGIRHPRAVLVVRVALGRSRYVSTLGADIAIGPEPAACLRDAACNLVAPCPDFNPHHLGTHDWRTWADCRSCGTVFLLRSEAGRASDEEDLLPVCDDHPACQNGGEPGQGCRRCDRAATAYGEMLIREAGPEGLPRLCLRCNAGFRLFIGDAPTWLCPPCQGAVVALPGTATSAVA